MLSKAQGTSPDGEETSQSPGGVGDGVATVESRPVLPQKIKNRIVPPRGLYPKELEAGSPNRSLGTHIHSSVVCNGQNAEAPGVHRWMNGYAEHPLMHQSVAQP